MLRPPLWKRCVSNTLKATWGMGDKIYVEEHFGKAGKTLAEEMIQGIKDLIAWEKELEAA